jgi:glycogen operon protein
MVGEEGEPIVDSSFLLLLNAHYEDVTFTLPARRFGRRWQVELSTADPRAPKTVLTARGTAIVTSRSLLLLREPDAPPVR